MKSFPVFVVVAVISSVAFTLGVVLGLISQGLATPAPVNYGADITVLRTNRPDESGVPLVLRPHFVEVDGHKTRVGPVSDPYSSWVIRLDGGRVVITAEDATTRTSP